jgi:predicted NAD/FAD-binding protein
VKVRHLFEREAHASGRRIAVIGAGVAGLSAAWQLSKLHRVVLYEKNSWLGGHANTVDVACPEGPVPVDTGFIVYNPRNYPNFTAMLDHLGVGSVGANMSFGASIGDGRVEYSSNLRGLFGQPQNLVSLRFWRMIAGILRFYDHTGGLDHGAMDNLSLGEFLERERYSEALAEDHVLPMCAAIWSTTPAQMRAYPMRSFLRFFSSHGLLQLANRPQWRSVKGGSRAYVAAMRSDMPAVSIRPAARRVVRNNGLAMVEDSSGSAEFFTDVVLASHADETLALLDDPSPRERALLGAFRYTPNVAVLHDDAALMPQRRSVWSSWNYIGAKGTDAERPLCVSYWMNALQRLETKRNLFVTLNPVRPPRPESLVASFEYTHPLFDGAALVAQERLWELQGERNTWFCGSYFGYGFHEDALQSGLAVAEMLGAARPWGPTPTRIATAPLLQAAE